MGLSGTALAKWETKRLHKVQDSSYHRVLLIAATCQVLRGKFDRASDVGAFLLERKASLGAVTRPVDLVVRFEEPALAVELLDRERQATLDVVSSRLPSSAFEAEAWSDLIDGLPSDFAQVFREWEAAGKTKALPAVL